MNHMLVSQTKHLFVGVHAFIMPKTSTWFKFAYWHLTTRILMNGINLCRLASKVFSVWFAPHYITFWTVQLWLGYHFYYNFFLPWYLKHSHKLKHEVLPESKTGIDKNFKPKYFFYSYIICIWSEQMDSRFLVCLIF